MYTFAGGQIKLANKKFTSITNDYCITFDTQTIIKPAGQDKTIQASSFSFTTLEQIEAALQSCTVDVIGAVLDVSPVSTINLRDGSMREKRQVTICDDTKRSIGVTLWGEACQKSIRELQIVAFRSCRISEFKGKSLNASSASGDIVVDPDHPRMKQLRRWMGDRSVSELRDDLTSLGGDQQEGMKKNATVTLKEMETLVENDFEIQNSGRAGYYNVDCYLSWIFVDETL